MTGREFVIHSAGALAAFLAQPDSSALHSEQNTLLRVRGGVNRGGVNRGAGAFFQARDE